MLEGIEVVTADIHILAVAVLRQSVVLGIRAYDGCGVHVGKHARIVLAKKGEPRRLVCDIRSLRQCCLERLNIKLSLCGETMGEVLAQHGEFLVACLCRGIVSQYILYHGALSDIINYFAKLRKNNQSTKI